MRVPLHHILPIFAAPSPPPLVIGAAARVCSDHETWACLLSVNIRTGASPFHPDLLMERACALRDQVI